MGSKCSGLMPAFRNILADDPPPAPLGERLVEFYQRYCPEKAGDEQKIVSATLGCSHW